MKQYKSKEQFHKTVGCETHMFHKTVGCETHMFHDLTYNIEFISKIEISYSFSMY